MEDYDEYILYLQNENPKIDIAMKNYISVLLGRSFAASDTDNTLGMISFSTNQALLCAKIVLKAIQSIDLLDYLEFSSQYPQREMQTGLDRIQELSRYKALRFLRDRVISSNQSVNKFFGKSYFLWSKQWTSVAEKILASDPGTISKEQLHYFVHYFGESLSDETHIVWSIDFQETIYKRSQQRKEAIVERNSRVEVLEDEDDSSS